MPCWKTRICTRKDYEQDLINLDSNWITWVLLYVDAMWVSVTLSRVTCHQHPKYMTIRNLRGKYEEGNPWIFDFARLVRWLKVNCLWKSHYDRVQLMWEKNEKKSNDWFSFWCGQTSLCLNQWFWYAAYHMPLPCYSLSSCMSKTWTCLGHM